MLVVLRPMQRCTAWKSRRVVRFERDSIYSVAYWRGTFPGRQDARRRGAVSATQACTQAHTHTRAPRENREKSVLVRERVPSFLSFSVSRVPLRK